MSFEIIDWREAKEAKGLRMVIVPGVPSPWGEAAKGILHVKGLDFTGFHHDPSDAEQAAWLGGGSAPVLFSDTDPPKSNWAEILMLAERLSPTPALLPEGPYDRAMALGIAHEICGENGLGWARRLDLIRLGLAGEGGFRTPVAHYLAPKYGYTEEAGRAAHTRVLELLGFLSRRLEAQAAAGSDYYFGEMTAVDIYSATFAGLLRPLPDDVCPMKSSTRAAFETADDETLAAGERLLAHRDMMYERWLETPLLL